MFEISSTGSGTPNPNDIVSHDYSNYEKNNYTARPSTFMGDSIKFEWWKSEMYTHIIDLDNELCDIIEDGINILINGVGMVTHRKSITPSQKKTYRNTIELEVFW